MPTMNGIPLPVRNLSATHARDWIHLSQNDLPLGDPSTVQRESKEANITASAKNSIVDYVALHFADVVKQIWAGDRIGEYLAATDARRHVWHAWLSSNERLFQVGNRMSIDLAYSRLTFARGPDLIEQAYACRPAGIMRALGRLGVQARFYDVYRALVQVLATGGPAATLIQHAKELPDELIRGLSTLPRSLQTKPVLEILKNGHVSDESLYFFAGTLERLKAQSPQAVEVILDDPKPLEAMWDALQDLPFPEPPWLDDDQLIAVTSRSRLLEIAREFQNCLWNTDRQLDAVMSVINGNRYFYELREEPALLEFIRIGSLGWYLRDFCGPRNRTISERTRDQVIQMLTQHPSFCAVWEPRWHARYEANFSIRRIFWAT